MPVRPPCCSKERNRSPTHGVPNANTLAAHRLIILYPQAAGKHVLCEKPIAENAADAASMHAAAEEAGVFLQDAMVSCAAATQSRHTVQPHVQAFQAGGLVCMWLRLVAVKTD